MKFGTVPKIIAGAVAIIVLAVIGTLWLISASEDSTPEVEVVVSSPNEFSESVAQTDTARKDAVTAASREEKPQISAEEMQQIEDFFAQLESANLQSEMGTPQSPTDTVVAQNTDGKITTNTDVFAEDIEQTAKHVMSTFVKAFKIMDFEAMAPLMTGVAKERFNEAAAMGFPLMAPENAPDMPAEMRQVVEQTVLEHFSRLEVVSSKYVGDEFLFGLGAPPPKIPGVSKVNAPNEIYKMRKENGVWRIYDSETSD